MQLKFLLLPLAYKKQVLINEALKLIIQIARLQIFRLQLKLLFQMNLLLKEFLNHLLHLHIQLQDPTA